MAWDDTDPVVIDMEQRLLTLFDTLSAIARGTGSFPSNAARDAAIRACARALMILLRSRLSRTDAAD